MAPEQSHRYWFSVNVPDIGVRWQCGWTFGADALQAATNAVHEIRKRDKRAEYLLANDVYVTHDTACGCLPEEMRTY